MNLTNSQKSTTTKKKKKEEERDTHTNAAFHNQQSRFMLFNACKFIQLPNNPFHDSDIYLCQNIYKHTISSSSNSCNSTTLIKLV